VAGCKFAGKMVAFSPQKTQRNTLEPFQIVVKELRGKDFPNDSALLDFPSDRGDKLCLEEFFHSRQDLGSGPGFIDGPAQLATVGNAVSEQ
jgi:hypothetical protein